MKSNAKRGVLDYNKINSSILSSVQFNDSSFIQPLSYSAQYSSTWITCNVPMIKQSTSNICWAASMASIGNFINHVNLSDSTVASNAFPGNWNRGASIDEAVYALFCSYGIQYSYHYYAPSDNDILNRLLNNRPIYSEWEAPFVSDHAMVISGIDVIAGYLQVMNPTYGAIQTASLSGGTYTLNDVLHGVTYSLIYFAN